MIGVHALHLQQPMALDRLGVGSPALLALAGAAGGGGLPWALWALQTARDPHVQEVAAQAGAAGAAPWSSAAEWVDTSVRQNFEEGEFCIAEWKLYFGIGAIIFFLFILIGVIVAVACFCGPLGFFGGHAWARRGQPPRQTPRDHLTQLADFISAGGESAIQAAAKELAVSPDAVRSWWVQWVLVHRGPRRG